MDESESLSHSKWECKYHVVFIPKCRRRTLYEELRRHLGEVLRKLAEQKESRIEEGHLMPDHVHMLISIPPKYAVSQVIGTSRARVRSTWRGCTASTSAILLGSTFGLGGTSSRRWVGTRRWCGSTSETKRRRISDWTSSTCGADRPPSGGPRTAGPR